MTEEISVDVQIPEKLQSVFEGEADVRGSYGGRGSAKTRTFAKMSAVRAYIWARAGREGIILCARQYMNSLDDSSLEEIKLAITSEDWLNDFFEIGERYIKTRDGRIQYKFAGLDRNISSIKSKSRILLCWVDEAEPVVDKAWSVLIPTLREEDSELWVTWNPERKGSPVDQRFRNSTDPRIKVAEMNYMDNAKFPAKLNRDRLRDKAERPDQYDHVWMGAFVTAVSGAYFAKHLTKAKDEHRIGPIGEDPLMTHRLFVDIGGTGAKADAFSIWDAQFIGKEIRVLRYYEAVGQPIATHLAWMRSHDLTPDKAQIWLPHDGKTNDRIYDVSYESALEAAGYDVTVIPNQGKGAAMARIESVRRTFPNAWFNKVEGAEGNTDCTAGLESLGFYHEKRDDTRQIGLGPEHDFASHGADAYGLASIVYEAYQKETKPMEDPYSSFRGYAQAN
jgi:phage terminase large subunit